MTKSNPPLSQRIKSIDSLRGLAVIGIIFVNILDMLFMRTANESQVYKGIDSILVLLYDLFIEIKLYSVFAFLFGMGCWMIYKRATEEGENGNRVLLKRNITLLALGLLHYILLWNGDILFTYALIALFLPLFMKRNNKTLVIWAGSLLALGVIASFVVQMSSSSDASTIITQYRPFENYLQGVQERFTTELPNRLVTRVIYLFDILPLFLLGIVAARKNLFNEWKTYSKKLNIILSAFAIIGILTSIPLLTNYFASENYNVYNVLGFLFLSSKFVALTYILLFIKLYEFKHFQKLVNIFSETGRMSLSTYLSQTIITLTYFAIMYENTVNIRVWQTFIYSVCLIVFQIIFNKVWLHYFKMGWFESLWRFMYRTKSKSGNEKAFSS